MTKKKVFPRIDLRIPTIEHDINADGRKVIPLHIVPPAETRVRFPAKGNATAARSFDFAPWYGRGIDTITYACQQQTERFLCTHDGDRSVASVVSYCSNGLVRFLDYLLIRSVAMRCSLTLADIDRELIDGYLSFLDDGKLSTNSQKANYKATKSVLLPLCQRGLISWVDVGDDATFPSNPFPNAHRKSKGERPLPKAQRRAFTAAIKTAVMPLLYDTAEPTSEILAFALLVIALHTGRNTTPLLELSIDCLRAHPKEAMQFLVVYKRRGHRQSLVVQRDDVAKGVESTPTVRPTVVRLIRRVIELTATLRQEAPDHVKDRLWLFRTTKGNDIGAVSTLTNERLGKAAARLVKRARLVDADGQPLRVNVNRLRKTFVNRIHEILGDDLVTTAVAAGNTPKVTGDHYLRLGENAQRKWMFMGRALTTELMTATLGATEKTPAGRCTDNKHGQFAPKKDGATCMSFLDCLRCRNYVVTGEDLYRLFSFYWRIYRERERIGKVTWKRNYAHIVRLIDRDVIEPGIKKKIFKLAEVNAARELARTSPHPFWSLDGILESLQ